MDSKTYSFLFDIMNEWMIITLDGFSYTVNYTVKHYRSVNLLEPRPNGGQAEYVQGRQLGFDIIKLD
jgi:hypothetical protein